MGRRTCATIEFFKSWVLNLCGRTKSGTKVSSAAPIPFDALSPSIAFNLSYKSLYFCCASVLSTWTTSPFPDPSCSLGFSGSCTNIGLTKLPLGLTPYCPDSCTCPIDGVTWGNVDAPIGGEGIGHVSWVVWAGGGVIFGKGHIPWVVACESVWNQVDREALLE